MKKLEEKYSIKPIVEFDIVEDDAMDLVLGGAGDSCLFDISCRCRVGLCLNNQCECDLAYCNVYSPCAKNF